MQFQAIQYLRWARQAMAVDPEVVPLTFSGMQPPDPDWVGSSASLDLLTGVFGDHPPLAEDLAAVWGVRPRQVLVQPGSHWSLLVLLAARLRQRPGPVALEFPCYEPLLRIPQFLGAEIVRVERSLADGWRLREETLAALTDRFPSVFLLSQPHNPTGAALTAEELDALASWAEAADCAVLSDEVYLEFLEDWPDRTALGRIPGAAIVRSFTKVMGLGSLRVSGVAGPEEWIAEAARFTDYGPVAVPGPSQALARRAWSRREALWTRAREAAAQGRGILEEWLDGQRGRISGHLPRRGIICFLRLEQGLQDRAVAWARDRKGSEPFGYGLDAQGDGSHVWLDILRREARVQLTPGGFFEDPAAFRLGYGIPGDQLRDGLTRLQRTLDRIEEEA